MAKMGAQSPNFYSGFTLGGSRNDGYAGTGNKRPNQNIHTGFGQMTIGGTGGGTAGKQAFLNNRSNGSALPGSTFARAGMSQPTTASRGFNPSASGGMDLNSLLGMQTNAFNDARNENRQNFAQDSQGVLGAVDRFKQNPITQGVNSLTQGLLANPEAINDQVQQRIINRGSNLINAQAQTGKEEALSALGGRGLANSSAVNEVNQQLNRQAGGQLSELARQTELDRAMRRNQDISNAIGLGQGVSGQLAGYDMQANQSVMQARPQVLPQDFSMYALAAANQNTGQAMANAIGNQGYAQQLNQSTADNNANRNSILDNLDSMGSLGSQLAERYRGNVVGGATNGSQSTYLKGNPFQDTMAMGPGGQQAQQAYQQAQQQLQAAQAAGAPPETIARLQQQAQMLQQAYMSKVYNASQGGIPQGGWANDRYGSTPTQAYVPQGDVTQRPIWGDQPTIPTTGPMPQPSQGFQQNPVSQGYQPMDMSNYVPNTSLPPFGAFR